MILKEIFDKVDAIEESNTYLYFITRILKPETKRNEKSLNKYIFKVYQIDVNDEIRTHLYSLTKEQINLLIKKKVDLHEYDVITDDSQQLFSYQMTSKTMAFADVVNKQLKGNIPKITNLEELIKKEILWAYCAGFYNKDDEWLYTFRKILSGKVAIDESEGNAKSGLQKALRTIFNTKSNKLELIEGETINLDKQVDCLYYKDTFYIAKKTQFEQIVGLEDEYKAQATSIVSELKDLDMIEGIELLVKQIETNPSIHKKLVRLSKLGNYKTLDLKAINKIEAVAKEFGHSLKLKEGKLFIEDDNDIDLVLKMLSDYYKEGKVSGKAYGTFAGVEISLLP